MLHFMMGLIILWTVSSAFGQAVPDSRLTNHLHRYSNLRCEVKLPIIVKVVAINGIL